MNLFKREIKKGFMGFLIWSITLIAIIFFTMIMFPSVSKNSSAMTQYINSLPTSISKALNISQQSMSDIINYYSSVMGTYVILCGGIYAMMLGASMISKEIDDKTIEFLQSKPLTRPFILTQKLSAGIFYVVALNIILFAGTFLSFEYVKTTSYSVKTLLLIFLGYLIIEITFVCLGLMLSLIINKKRISLSLSLWSVFGLYLLFILSNVSDKFKNLKYLSPFSYADSKDAIANGGYKLSHIIVLIIVIVISTVISYIIYKHKDISA